MPTLKRWYFRCSLDLGVIMRSLTLTPRDLRQGFAPLEACSIYLLENSVYRQGFARLGASPCPTVQHLRIEAVELHAQKLRACTMAHSCALLKAFAVPEKPSLCRACIKAKILVLDHCRRLELLACQSGC